MISATLTRKSRNDKQLSKSFLSMTRGHGVEIEDDFRYNLRKPRNDKHIFRDHSFTCSVGGGVRNVELLRKLLDNSLSLRDLRVNVAEIVPDFHY
jgi:hypothetical protein